MISSEGIRRLTQSRDRWMRRAFLFKAARDHELLRLAASQAKRQQGQLLAERLLDIALYKVEWVKAAGGKHYLCPLCGGVNELNGGPGHVEDCERFEIIKQFDALYPPKVKA